MIPIATLRDKYQGRAGAVMGGGPSLPKDILQIMGSVGRGEMEYPILIAVGHHGLEYVKADFTVFLDDVQNEPAKWELMRTRGGMKVSRQGGDISDVDLYGSDWWPGRFSAHLATWLACWLGCDPVLLCGMDCYQNAPPPEDAKNNAYKEPLEAHLKIWREAFKRCPHPERIKAVSGPLAGIFGKWDGK
jgi:hypothetical protein